MARGAVRRPAHGGRRGLRIRLVGAHRLPRHDARLLQRRVRCSSVRRAATNAPCTCEIVAARRPAVRRVARARRRCRARRRSDGFGTYRAADYDELIDHPVEMADFALGDVSKPAASRTTSRSPAAHDADMARLERDLARVCQWQIDLFGGRRRFAARLSVPGDGGRRRLRRPRASRRARASSAAATSLPHAGRTDTIPTTTSASSVSRATSISTRGT